MSAGINIKDINDKNYFFDGKTLEIPQGQNTGSCDWINEDIENLELHGVTLFLENAVFGDKCELDVYVRIGGVFYFALEYAKNYYLSSKVAEITIIIGANDAPAKFPIDYMLRLTYTAIDINGRKAEINYRFKR
jgi:hypothetical protein